MSIVTRQSTCAIAVALLALSAPAANAQVAPVQYWLPNGLFGLGGSATAATAYGNFPGFDARLRDGVDASDWRDNFRTGMFASSQSGNIGLNGLGLTGAASDFGGLSYQSALSGYAFKGAGDLPVSIYAGFDTLTYKPGIGSALAPFSTDTSLAAGYRARAGIAFQPAANVTLSFEAGFAQQQQSDGDAASRLLPAGRR